MLNVLFLFSNKVGSKLSAMKNNTPIKPMKDQLYLNGTIFNGEKVLDFMIPGNKVGFVIGKGGEMIRNLQVWIDLVFLFGN